MFSDGTISFSIQPFSGKKSIFWIFLKKTSEAIFFHFNSLEFQDFPGNFYNLRMKVIPDLEKWFLKCHDIPVPGHVRTVLEHHIMQKLLNKDPAGKKSHQCKDDENIQRKSNYSFFKNRVDLSATYKYRCFETNKSCGKKLIHIISPGRNIS
jgi:hypothetical protein